MSMQINYYELDNLEAESFKKLLSDSVAKVQQALQGDEGKSLDKLAEFVLGDAVVSEFLLLLARLPVFSSDFEILLGDTLEVLQILKKLKFFVNLKIRETLYLLVKLSVVYEDENAIVDLVRFFSVDPKAPQVETLIDLKFKSAINQKAIFTTDDAKRSKYIEQFERLEKIEPHAVYPTSIYRQSDGCTVATQDSQKIEAVMSTTLTTSIRISSHVLGYENPLLAEIYRPLGRAVVVLDDKLSDLTYTRDDVEIATNKRLTLSVDSEVDSSKFEKITIEEQLKRYFEHHEVKVTVLSKSGNEVDKDIENVKDILVDLKKLGVMRNEPVLIVGGGVIADIAGFACALFHRNTPYVMLATSIVAGIDAGPSPRTCCDGQGYKNAFGAFHPPVVTLTDRTLWKTMHPGMIRHGIAEIVKMAVVENRALFELLEKVGPKFLVKTKFGTDMSECKEEMEGVDLVEFNQDCESVVGMAMESYVRAEYGNLWETHQCRPHAYGHTWSPGYELPAGMLHGHAVATCMGFGAYLSWKHCDWIDEAQFTRICKLINDLELSLWHEVMEDKQIFHASTKKMIQKRGGNLAAPLPRGEIGECGYLNDISDDELSRYVDEYKYLVTSKMGMARNGYGVQAHLADVGLHDIVEQSTAFVRAEDSKTGVSCNKNHDHSDHGEEKKDDNEVMPMSYNDWIASVQKQRNSEWNFNVMFDKSPDTDSPPPFAANTLFRPIVEDYAMAQTSLSSSNVQTAAKRTQEQDMFAPCMVGTLESQFLKLMAKTAHAKSVLDVGTFTGMSAIAFAEGCLSGGCKSPIVHTLEFDKDTSVAAQGIFDECEDSVKNAIKLHHTNAVAWMRDLATNTEDTFDIIFIDADKDNYSAYYNLAMGTDATRPLLAEGGMILADNTLSALVYDQDDVRRVALHLFNQEVKNDDRVEQVVLTVREGITMITRK